LSYSSKSNFALQYTLGDVLTVKDGVRCYPATDRENGNRYIAKVHSFPAKPSTTEAFLLSGAFPNIEKVNAYYREQARELCKQAAILNALSHTEYFSHFSACQTEPKNDLGYDVWLLSPYKRSLYTILNKVKLSREDIIELGIHLCRGLTQCREAGFIYVGLKPQNIFLSAKGEFQIGDVGFVPISSLPYATLPKRYSTIYAPPECQDLFSVISNNTDVYSVGVLLYQLLTGGKQPESIKKLPDSVDKELSTVTMQACAPTPAKRWSHPRDLEQALTDCRKLR